MVDSGSVISWSTCVGELYLIRGRAMLGSMIRSLRESLLKVPVPGLW